MKNRTLNTIKKMHLKCMEKKKYYFIFYFLHFNEALVFFCCWNIINHTLFNNTVDVHKCYKFNRLNLEKNASKICNQNNYKTNY